MDPGANSRLPLAERYRPRRLGEIAGNPRARAELDAWARQWDAGHRPPARRAALLSGPAGVGKTTAALALAHEHGWTVVEMNASDARNEPAIERVAGRASITHSLDAAEGTKGRRRALILLDEADCLTGRLTEKPRTRAEPPALATFLQGRYGTVGALNAAYGLRDGAKPAPFADWSAIPKSPGNAAWARLPAARRDLDEWRGSQTTSDLSDRGGLGAIARLVRSTRQPVVLTVNDERPLTRYSPVFRTGVVRIRFFPVRDAEVRSRLVAVVRSERIALAEGALEAIVARARGDLRAALNDLDAVAPLPPGPGQVAVLGARDLSADFAALTEEVLGAPRFYRSVEISNRLDAPPDDLLPWVEENLPYFAVDARRRAAGFDVLAVAERFLARARRARVWSQWSYATELLTGGIALAIRDGTPRSGGGAGFPQFLGEMGRSRGARALRGGLTEKVARHFHLSEEKAGDAILPFLEGLFRSARTARGGVRARRLLGPIARELALTSEEVAYLMAVEPDASEAREIAEGPAEAPEPSSEPAPTSRRAARDRARPAQRRLSDFGR